MHKILLSVSLLMPPAGCAAILDLKDVKIVDGGADSGADSTRDSATSGRMYHCGYATPGHHCNNGRSGLDTIAPDMAAAIVECQQLKPMPALDFCYVKDLDGPAGTDASECTATSGSWRPARNCCNFEGPLSCPG
jgi:hypothetical protein